MLLLHEMGHTALIPEATVAQYVAKLNEIPLKLFPIHPGDIPEGLDPYRGTPCHCQLGNVYQVLAARGVDVDQVLPWIRPWFLKYQMADGGLSCDNDAYLVEDECPSSMVGTISAFEAILLHTNRPWTNEERTFLDQGARFLMERELRLGSATKHNAAERKSAEHWAKLCFPRFYLYDVLRGLAALVTYFEKTNQPLPGAATRAVIAQLEQAAPDGELAPGRLSFDDVTTIRLTETGEWIRRQPYDTFPLLVAVCVVGKPNPFLTRQWQDLRARLS
jgi:hypothetical protein